MNSSHLFAPLALAAPFALGALSAPASATDAAAADSGRKLSATLSGAAEVPGPGDADGRGSFTARINPGQGTLCYTLQYAEIGAAAAAHVHVGGTSVAGPVRVALRVEADGMVEDCATIDRDLAQALIRAPQDFYVNVHTAAFPAGAIRGQLGK